MIHERLTLLWCTLVYTVQYKCTLYSMSVHCTDMRDSRDCGVEDEPLLVLGVEVEVLHLLLPVEQPQADLIPVRGPAPELELEGGQKMTYK